MDRVIPENVDQGVHDGNQSRPEFQNATCVDELDTLMQIVRLKYNARFAINWDMMIKYAGLTMQDTMELHHKKRSQMLKQILSTIS